MTLMELKENLSKTNKLNSFYIFTGPEHIILKAYITKICNKFNGPIKEADSIKSVYNQLSSKSLLKVDNTCFIIRDDKELLSLEKSWDSVLSSKTLKNNVIVLVYSDLDKRGKFYKSFHNSITVFDKLSSDILVKYVLKELTNLHKDYATQLVSICDNSYERILLECNKLQNLSNSLHKNINETYSYAMDNAFIWIPPEDAIFSLVDSCLSRNILKCYHYLEECKRIGESNLNILFNLYNNFRTLLQVQSLGYNKEICKITGLQFYQVKQVSDKVNNYTLEEIINILNLIHYCETSVKNGTVDTDDVVDFLLVNIL